MTAQRFGPLVEPFDALLLKGDADPATRPVNEDGARPGAFAGPGQASRCLRTHRGCAAAATFLRDPDELVDLLVQPTSESFDELLALVDRTSAERPPMTHMEENQ